MLALAARAPGIRTGAFGKAHLLAALLDRDLLHDVNARMLRSGSPGSFVSAGIGYEPRGSTGTFRVSGSLDRKAGWSAAAEALRAEIIHRASSATSSGDEPWTRDLLSMIRLEERSSLTRLWEKPHYFGLDRAPYIACCGWDFTRDLLHELDGVAVADLKGMSAGLITPNAWAILMAGPDAPPGAAEDTPEAEQVPPAAARAESEVTPESRALVTRWKPEPAAPPPSGLGARPAASGGANARMVLGNGMTLSIDFTDDSRVFAAHVLLKNRCAAEPAGKAGIVEMLHRMAARGTRAHPGSELSRALSSIGATLKVTDDPSVPYDDIYLSPEYSYIRLESLDGFAEKSVALLAEIMREPNLDDAEALAEVSEQLVTRARQANASPRDRARLLLAQGLWGEKHAFAAPLFGTEEAIRSITSQDLKSFHRTYFSPRNMIVGIATSVRREKLLPLLDAKLGRWPGEGSASPAAGPALPADAPAPLSGAEGSRLLTEPIDSAQAYLMLGRLIPADPNADTPDPATSALAAVFSRRMGDLLREKRGLSYSLGADSGRLGDSVQFSIFMGVLPGSVEAARSGIHEVIAQLLSDPPGQQEIDDAIRSTRLRTTMRGLSRINRAYGRCMEELRGSAPPAPDAVTAEQVLRAARHLFVETRLDGWVEAVVGGTPAPAR